MKKRPYRTRLASKGLIYFKDKEMDISVKNLSITGFFAELKDNSVIVDFKDFLSAIKKQSTIDLYLPEMRVAGEVVVVRAEKRDGHIFLAFEFRNLSYNVDNLLYKRKVYRKNMTYPGQILLNHKAYHFFTKNVSVDGLMVLFNERVEVEIGTVTAFDYRQLQLRGKIKVIWIDYAEDGSTYMGLQYVNIETDHIQGIPHFSFIQD